MRPSVAQLCRLTSLSRHLCSRSHQYRLYSTTRDYPTLSDSQRKTIYALSTPPGKAGVAVFRVSGPEALRVRNLMVKHPERLISGAGGKADTRKRDVEPWKLERCRIVHPQSNEELDDGLVVFFKGPKSFTTEDVLELHTHSGRAIISSILNALGSLPYCRPAEPGEFTKRAYLGGRLDLTEAEGLKDLIDAETEGQRKIAMKAAGGTVRAQYEELRSGIIKCLANVEALIDFGEGEDLEEGVYDQARIQAHQLLATIETYLKDNRRGEIIRSGIRLAIFGPPNAGKSSLLNFLAQREAAIVTPIAGTTRDTLEVTLDIGGLPVIVVDTAGLRKTQDVVESIGVERAKDAVLSADISLCVLSLSDVLSLSSLGGPISSSTIRPHEGRNEIPHLPKLDVSPMLNDMITSNTIFLFNKSDLISDIQLPDRIRNTLIGPPSLRRGTSDVDTVEEKQLPTWVTSLNTGEGLNEFLDGLGKVLQQRFGINGDIGHNGHSSTSKSIVITRARHRAHLEDARQYLRAFLELSADDIVIGAEELRYAAKSLGKISGAIDVEDVLDSVFRDFCIGK